MRALALRDYVPRPMVRRALSTLDPRPPAPMIDAHNHLGRWLTGTWSVPDVGALVSLMDELGVETIVNPDGRWSGEVRANLGGYHRAYAGRFAAVAQWGRAFSGGDGWTEWGAQVADAVDR